MVEEQERKHKTIKPGRTVNLNVSRGLIMFTKAPGFSGPSSQACPISWVDKDDEQMSESDSASRDFYGSPCLAIKHIAVFLLPSQDVCVSS